MIFRHTSPHYYKTLQPTSYKEIENNRGAQYVRDRIETEKEYHGLVSLPLSNSFLYATIVGFHKMESSKTYPGYIYYFELTSAQIKNTIFHVVAQPAHTTKPIAGRKGLFIATKYWLEHEKEFQSYYDPIVGDNIDPRIEVVIGYPVKYKEYIPQIEDR